MLPTVTFCCFMLFYITFGNFMVLAINVVIKGKKQKKKNTNIHIPSSLECPLQWIHILILSNSSWRDGMKSPIDTQVWHIHPPGGQLETQQRADDCYHSAVSLSMESADTTQSNSHTSDIYLLAKLQQRSNYSKLSPYPWVRHTHKNPHTGCTLAKNLKMTKDGRVSRLHFIVLYGMQHSGGDRVWVGGKNVQILLLCRCVCVRVFVCVLEQYAWHHVSWFWMVRRSQMVFQGLYGGWWL